jgi:hypothetical protein
MTFNKDFSQIKSAYDKGNFENGEVETRRFNNKIDVLAK